VFAGETGSEARVQVYSLPQILCAAGPAFCYYLLVPFDGTNESALERA
jgi:hypothetical protein